MNVPNPPLSELGEALLSSLTLLRSATTQLITEVRNDPAVLGADLPDHAAPKASLLLHHDPAKIHTLSGIWGAHHYADRCTDGRSVLCHPGVLALPDPLLARVAEVNACKQAFESIATQCNQYHVNRDGLLVEQPISRSVHALLQHTRLPNGVYPFARWLLHQQGEGSLNLRQTWRAIQVQSYLGCAPDTLRFTWLHKRVVSRLRAGEVKGKLAEYEDEPAHVREARHRIGAVSDREYVARIRTPEPQLQLSAIWREAHADSTNQQITVLATQPVVIPLIGRPRYIRAPDLRDKRDNSPRRRIEDQPLIDFLNIYRYRPEYRTFDNIK